MNKQFIISFAMLMPAVLAYASDTDISSYENIIYIESGLSVSLESDGSAIIPVKMKNSVESTGFQFSLTLPEGMSTSDIKVRKSTARKYDEVSFSSGVQKDGRIIVVAYTTDDSVFSGNDGEIATITISDAVDGDYSFELSGIEITSHGNGYKPGTNVRSTVTIDGSSNDEGYAVQLPSFAMDSETGPVEQIFIMHNKSSIVSISFDVSLSSKAFNDYSLIETSGIRGISSSINHNEDGTYSISASKSSPYFDADVDISLVKFTFYLQDVNETFTLPSGIYTINISNIVMADADGKEFHPAPYAANIIVGSPKATPEDGKVKFSGDYSDEETAEKLIEAIPTDDTNVTAIDLSGVTALPENTTIPVANPNAFILTKTDLGLGNTTNVIIDKTCKNLQVTDGEPFEAPTNFTAENATYYRELTEDFGTICLPYAPSTDLYTFYELGTSSNGKLCFNLVEQPKADTPYLYAKKEDNGAITASSVNVSKGDVKTAVVGEWQMKGTFKEEVLTDNVYFLSNNELYMNTDTLMVKPFRSYLSNTASGLSSVEIFIDNTPSGIILLGSGEFIRKNADRYNLSGQKVGEAYKGIVIVNGRKIMNR